MHDRTGTTVDSDSGGSPNDSESLMGGGTGINYYIFLLINSYIK
jgi:hypothetical protein